MSINIGMSEAQRKTIAEGLAKVLADSYTLYLKTHKFHWNVEGPMFRTLHLMFEEQYTELATAVDEIAERIRALVSRRRLLQRIRRTDQHQRRQTGHQRYHHDPRTRRRPGNRGAHLPRSPACCGRSQRRTNQRSAHQPHANPRKSRVDAARPAGKIKHRATTEPITTHNTLAKTPPGGFCFTRNGAVKKTAHQSGVCGLARYRHPIYFHTTARYTHNIP